MAAALVKASDREEIEADLTCCTPDRSESHKIIVNTAAAER